jgi:hypothetical protein
MKYIFILLAFFYLNGSKTFSSESGLIKREVNEANLQNSTKEGIPIDTTKVLFFLDGKKASAKATLWKMQSDSVQYITGYGSSKKAIFHFGEKARHGLLVFKSMEKNGKE